MPCDGKRKKTINKKNELFLTESLLEIPSNMSNVLESSETINKISKNVIKAKVLLFLGEDYHFQLLWRAH